LAKILRQGNSFKPYRLLFSREMSLAMPTLIYKRTHSGDPDPNTGVAVFVPQRQIAELRLAARIS
jgi:hypothetical protein